MRMNPVYKNELKMSARSMQLPVLAVIFNSILSVVALIALYGIRQNYINSGGNPYHSMMILYVVFRIHTQMKTYLVNIVVKIGWKVKTIENPKRQKINVRSITRDTLDKKLMKKQILV